MGSKTAVMSQQILIVTGGSWDLGRGSAAARSDPSAQTPNIWTWFPEPAGSIRNWLTGPAGPFYRQTHSEPDSARCDVFMPGNKQNLFWSTSGERYRVLHLTEPGRAMPPAHLLRSGTPQSERPPVRGNRPPPGTSGLWETQPWNWVRTTAGWLNKSEAEICGTRTG